MSKIELSYALTACLGIISGNIISYYLDKNDTTKREKENKEYYKRYYYNSDNKEQNLKYIAELISENMKEIPESVDYPREVNEICDEIKRLLNNETILFEEKLKELQKK